MGRKNLRVRGNPHGRCLTHLLRQPPPELLQPTVSANLKCPVPANLKCPLFRSSGAACRTPCHKGWGQAHRLQAAGGQRYGERAEVPGGAAYALSGRGLLLNVCLSCRTPASWAAASLKAATAERNTGVPLSSAPRGFPWAGRGPAGRSDRSGRDGPEAARRTGRFSFPEMRTFQLCSDKFR